MRFFQGIHKNTWTTFFLQVAAGDTIEENAKFAPQTAALVRDIPGVYTSFFSILEPHTKLGIHWGYFKVRVFRVCSDSLGYILQLPTIPFCANNSGLR